MDAAVPQYDMDKLKVCKELGAEILFVGDDWYETEKWKKYEEDFEKEKYELSIFLIQGSFFHKNNRGFTESSWMVKWEG